MSHHAIQVEGLGKSYLIGHEAERERYTALRDVIASGARRIAKGLRDRMAMRSVASGMTTEEFWALRDVGFTIREGEVVGIIGRNGAGKSTLLKVLSRITEPSRGRVTINGRVASLLEVGTGFHPELSGRENIFLNGAILGMTRGEIRRKFDEIVSFAEVERFLDTPVKRYSSGMYVRLAFAVAAHLEPDILVVDEVLAVGDAEFQKKCLGKMQTVAGHGRTVLFVSHNMAAIQSLCHRALCLRSGELIFDGNTAEGLKLYAVQGHSGPFTRDVPDKDIHLAEVSDVSIERKPDGLKTSLILRAGIASTRPVKVNVDVRIRDMFGGAVAFSTLGNDRLVSPVELKPGLTHVDLAVDVTRLVVGNYSISVDISTPFVEWHDQADDVAQFSIETHHRSHVVQPTRQEWGFGSVQLDIERR
jgi:lipopolysaccharide transport system ATP-binding protein